MDRAALRELLSGGGVGEAVALDDVMRTDGFVAAGTIALGATGEPGTLTPPRPRLPSSTPPPPSRRSFSRGRHGEPTRSGTPSASHAMPGRGRRARLRIRARRLVDGARRRRARRRAAARSAAGRLRRYGRLAVHESCRALVELALDSPPKRTSDDVLVVMPPSAGAEDVERLRAWGDSSRDRRQA